MEQTARSSAAGYTARKTENWQGAVLKKKNGGELLHKALLAPLLLAIATVPAIAQVKPDAGRVLEEAQKRPVAPQPQRDVLPKQEIRPALPGDSKLSVKVVSFRITGNTVYSEAELLALLNDFVGKQLDFAGVNEAATKVRSYYRGNGYFLAQAYLPRQKIESGVVEIAVIEGRLGEVKVNQTPESRLAPWLAQGIIGTHLQSGDLITEASLERPLLILSDLPGTSVSSEITPSKTLGAADLTVKLDNSGNLISGSLELDNYGNRFTGEYRLTGAMSVNNPFGLGDLISFSGIKSYGDFEFARVAYLVPVWYYGTRVGVSYAQFNYALGKDFENLQAHGKGDVASIYALHPLIRSRNANLILQLAYEQKNLKDEIDSTSSIETRDIKLVRAGVVGDFRDTLAGGGLNSFSFNYTDGRLSIEQPTVLADDQDPATGLKTEGNFKKVNYEFKRLQRISDDLNLLLGVTGQQALNHKNLGSAEKFSLGGPNGVRAYPTGESSGSSGYVINAELRYIIPGFKLMGGDLTVAGFYDKGHIRAEENQVGGLVARATNRRNISGYGLGLSLGKSGDFIIRSSIAVRANDTNDDLRKPISDTARSQRPRVWVQGIKWF
jgi:hemolysin activation/secretion protein